MAEYRIEELAAAAGVTHRTLQAYRNRGLLPPSERRGRFAFYNEFHLERLRLIVDLLDRGYSLNAIDELLTGLGRGEAISELLGVPSLVADHDLVPVTVTAAELLERFGADDLAIDQACRLGVLRPIGSGADEHAGAFAVVNPDLFDAVTELLALGLPLDVLVGEGLAVRNSIDVLAGRFVRLVADHLLRDGVPAPHVPVSSLGELVERLLPLAEQVVRANITPALERHVHDELGVQLDNLLAPRPAGT